MGIITLEWPPASLSGHNNGNPHVKAKEIKARRLMAAEKGEPFKALVPDAGDIVLRVTFVLPDQRSDRINLPNRMKPYFDGLADAWGVNDKRFAIPQYRVAEVCKPGWVEVEIIHTIAAQSAANGGTVGADSGIKAVQEGVCRAAPEPDRTLDRSVG